MKNNFKERCDTSSSIKNPTTLLPTEPETEMRSHEEENAGERSMTIFVSGIRKTPAIWFIIFISVLLLFFFCTTTAKKQEYNDI